MAKRPASPRKPESAGPAKSGERALGPDCRVVLLTGPESYLRAGYTDQLKKAAEQAFGEAQVVRFDGETAPVADVLDECRSMGLLAPYKIVVVDNADLLLKEPGEDDEQGEKPKEAAPAPRARALSRRALLERYAQSPSDNITLVLRAESWHKGNLDKYIEHVGLIIACEPLTAQRAAAWAAARAQRAYERTIEPPAVELLVVSLNADLGRIDGELQKLAGATMPGQPITADLVERLVAPVAAERKPWELADHLLNPSAAPGFLKLHELVDRCGLDPVPLRWACIDLASKVHSMAHEIAGGTPPHAAGRSLKFFFGPKAEAARRAAHAAGPAEAARLLESCVEADFRGKTGGEDPVRGLEAIALKFSAVAALSAPPRNVR